jgi:hypothetical protein
LRRLRRLIDLVSKAKTTTILSPRGGRIVEEKEYLRG